jgi:glycerol-3-phosphate cytidylyltransferase
MVRTVLTYGTFDLLHVGHLNLLRRARALGARLVVGISTNEFNATKGKRTIMDFEDRLEIVRSIRYVDEVFPESCWDQKIYDVRRFNANTFVMGDDWEGKFDFLKEVCEVVYLPRTRGVSSTSLRSEVSKRERQIQDARKTLEVFPPALGTLP